MNVAATTWRDGFNPPLRVRNVIDPTHAEGIATGIGKQDIELLYC